jgi:hypothetical protein
MEVNKSKLAVQLNSFYYFTFWGFYYFSAGLFAYRKIPVYMSV